MSSRIRDWGLRSPYDKTGGLVYFGRMLDKIRSHARRELPEAYAVNLGKGFDEKCTGFLRVSYELVVEYVHDGLEDEAILQSCFAMGRQPSEAEIYMWNEFMRKRGWHDDETDGFLAEMIKKVGLRDDGSVLTYFDLIEMDEGR